MSPYKGRPSAKTIAREFPFVVETMIPEGVKDLATAEAFVAQSSGTLILPK